jgi:hypothetical protein
LQFSGHRVNSQFDRYGRAESMNRGLKLYGLPGRNVLDGNPTVANADFVLVVEVEIEAEV